MLALTLALQIGTFESDPQPHLLNPVVTMPDTCDSVGRAAALQMTTSVSTSQIIAFLVNVLNQSFIGFVAVYMTWMCVKVRFVKTGFHAWFCTIGFCVLMAEGVMTFYQGNILTHPFSPEAKTTLHWVMQAVGGAMGIIGSVQKIIGKKKHFKSIHAKVGFAATVLCAVNMLAGLSALYSAELKSYLSPLFNKQIHAALGVITFILGMIAQYYGYETGFFVRKVDYDFKVLIKFLTIATVVLTIIGPVKNIFYAIASDS